MKLTISKFIKRGGVTLSLLLITVLLGYGVVSRYRNPVFYIYHYKKVIASKDNLKEELCFLSMRIKKKWSELYFQKKKLSEEVVFTVLETTLLKPNSPLIEKVSPMRAVSIRKVWLTEDFLIVDFNREFLFLTQRDEVKTLNTLLLSIIDNFTQIKEVSFIVQGRAIGRLHSEQDYALPIKVTSFTNLTTQIKQQKIVRKLRFLKQFNEKLHYIKNCAISQ